MITHSIFFYFVLPLGLVVAGALAAFLQGLHFKRKKRLRNLQKNAIDQNDVGHRTVHRRGLLPVGALIGCSFLLTVAMMGIIEHSIDENTSQFAMSHRVTPPVRTLEGLVLPTGEVKQSGPYNPVYIITAIPEDQLSRLIQPPLPSLDPSILNKKIYQLSKETSDPKNDLDKSKAIQ